MRKLCVLLTTVVLAISTSSPAQNLYDLTSYYLDNAGFDSGYNHTADESGNVAQEICTVSGWTKASTVNYTIAGIYQYGTARTFNGTPIPAKGYDGTSNGGCLALSTGWNSSLTYYQQITLPAGEYQLVSAWYNPSSKTEGKSINGFVSTGGIGTSTLKSFPVGVWTVDTVKFTVTKQVSGRLNVGFTATLNSGSANMAKVVLDYVKLYRTTPADQADAAIRKVDLQTVITSANTTYGDGTGTNGAKLKSAIDAAQTVYDNTNATVDEVVAAISTLKTAVDAYLWDNPTGNVPTVTTDTRYARGATMAFGRMTVSGVTASELSEQGFCYGLTSEPTINDHRTTSYLSNGGNIYWLKDLTPSTKYYMRAYVITTGKRIAYGDVIKFYTIPKGGITYTIRDGGDDATKTRITNAVKTAVDYWNNLTEIQNFSPNVGYNSGTPTAECSYGGYMSVGPNTSYQATGTILHEMLHGVGVIPWADTQWSRHILRSGVTSDGYGTGLWLGDRVTEVLRFWDNNTTENLNGDYQHLWPYGVNGASEDKHTDELYIGNALICQALGEDGLEHTTSHFAEPYYALNQEDNVKYYIKNESKDRGLYTSFLKEMDGHLVKYVEMPSSAVNDSAAWYVTFNPVNQYYQFRNVATGNNLSLSSSALSTKLVPAITSTENFQLMKARINAISGSDERGYWVVRHAARNPQVVAANANGAVGVSTFDISNDATAQRWLIMTADEAAQFDKAAVSSYSNNLTDALNRLKTLRAVTHIEDAAGTDAAADAVIAKMETALTQTLTIEQLSTDIAEVNTAIYQFLCNATPTDKPFDLTDMITNPGMSSTSGWTAAAMPTLNYSAAEYYQSTFDFYQTLTKMPAGNYQISAQAFQRPGTAANAYSSYQSGTSVVTSYLYGGDKSLKIHNIFDAARTSALGTGSESNVGVYVPNDMQSAAAYFAQGLYRDTLTTNVANDGDNLRFGIRCATSSDYYWTIFDDFHLYYYGSKSIETGIRNVNAVDNADRGRDVYSMSGVLLIRNAVNLESLPHGMYIFGGKKIVK